MSVGKWQIKIITKFGKFEYKISVLEYKNCSTDIRSDGRANPLPLSPLDHFQCSSLPTSKRQSTLLLTTGGDNTAGIDNTAADAMVAIVICRLDNKQSFECRNTK